MLLHCDLVLVPRRSSSLTAPFVNLALVPEAASSLLLPARIGHARAFSMFVLGEASRARKPSRWGWRTRHFPGDVAAAARLAAETLARKPAGSLVATKKLMRDAATLLSRMHQEGEVFAERLKSAEAREAFAAFAERRAPDFSKNSA